MNIFLFYRVLRLSCEESYVSRINILCNYIYDIYGLVVVISCYLLCVLLTGWSYRYDHDLTRGKPQGPGEKTCSQIFMPAHR